MPRKRGPLEERLRGAVRKQIVRRGDKRRLADAIGEDPGFVTNYLEGKEHANLDKTVAIAKHYKFSLRMLTGLEAFPVRDQETAELLTLWEDVTSPEIRDAVLGVLRGAAARAHQQEGPQSAETRPPERRARARKTRSAS